MLSGGEANREPPVMNWRLGGQILGYDPRSLDGERMHNGMKGLPCGKLMMCANKVVVTYVRYSGSVKATGLAELANVIQDGGCVQSYENPAAGDLRNIGTF